MRPRGQFLAQNDIHLAGEGGNRVLANAYRDWTVCP
jgi:hypothetical protein